MTDVCDFSSFKRDAHGCLPIRAFSILKGGCTLPDDVRCFSMRYENVVEEKPTGNAHANKASLKLLTAMSPQREQKKPPREQKESEKMSEDSKPSTDLLGPVLPLVDKPLDSQVLVASETAIDDIKQLIPPGTDPGMATVLLAAVGVAGGGAAWKFYAQHNKNKHEQAMRRLEIEAMRADSRSAEQDNHRKCVAERVALEHKIQDLETRLDASEKKHSLALSSFDPDALEERLEKLEKASKPVRKRTPRKKAEG
jgi:hypothetical protein